MDREIREKEAIIALNRAKIQDLDRRIAEKQRENQEYEREQRQGQ